MSAFATWRWTTLGDECEIVSGSTPKTNEPTFWDGDIPWLTPADLSKWKGTYIDGGSRYISEAGFNSCSARLFPRNTVMMSSRAPIGYTAIANREMCTNQGFKSMLPSQTVDPEWLRYFLEHALPEIKAMASGTTFAEISGKKLGTLPMHLPSLDEQRRIVEALDDHLSRLDKALAETQNAMTKATTYWHSMLHSLLFRDDSGNLASTVQLGSLAELVMGQAPAGSDCNKNGVGTPFVKVGEFGTTSPEIKEWTTKPLKMATSSDVLICVVGATIGKLNLGIECAIGRSVAAVRPGLKLRQKYLYYFLQTKVLEIRASSKGSAQGVITRQQLLEMPIPALSLDAQDRILQSLETSRRSLDDALSDLHKVSSSTSTLRRSVLNTAFTGNLRTTGNEIQ